MTPFRVVLAVCVWLTWPCESSGQALRLGHVARDASRFPEMTATFDVLAGDGGIIDALQPSDVTVLEGTQAISGQVTQRPPAEGVAYLIVVDTSGSMRDLLAPAAEALADFVSSLGDRDRVAVVAVAEQVTSVAAFTADRASLASALRGLRAEGRRTELYYGLFGGLEQLAAPGLPSRKVVLLVSDGRNEGVDYTIDDCLKRAADLSATIVGFGIDLRSRGQAAPLSVQRLATMSGGPYIAVEPGQSWSDKLALAPRFVASRATVTWTSTLPLDGQSHPFTLRVRSRDLVREHQLAVTTPLAVLPFWSRQWQGLPFWALAASAAVLLLCIALVIGLGVRRSRQRVQAITQALDHERARAAEAKLGIERRIDAVQAKLEMTPSPTLSLPAPRPADKRRTAFQAGTSAAPEPYRAAALHVGSGPLLGARLPLLKGCTTLGRDDDNHIVVDDDKVSLHHAQVVERAGAFWLEDRGSTNGTFLVDGTRVVGAGVPLRDSQQFQLGAVVFTFEGER